MQYRECSCTPVLFVECTMAIDGRRGKDIPLTCRNGHSKRKKKKKTKLMSLAFTLGFKGPMTKFNP